MSPGGAVPPFPHCNIELAPKDEASCARHTNPLTYRCLFHLVAPVSKTMKRSRALRAVVVTSWFLGAGFLGGGAATADNLFGSDEGKFLLTAGFNDLEGSGGGGLVPLAFISGYGSSDSWGANAHFTNIQLKDFQLRA